MLSMTELAKECIKIEKRGGDVLAYLKSQGKISPRGTWFRIQKEILERKDHQMTDGHENESLKNGIRRSREENMEIILKAIEEKRSPLQALRELGYKKPENIYRDTKEWILDHFPEYEEVIPKDIRRWMAENKKRSNDPIFIDRKKKTEVTVSEKLPLEAGKNYQLSVAETPEKPKEITKPLSYDGFIVRCISNYHFGRIYFDEKHDRIEWVSKNGEEVIMSREEWIAFARDLPRALRVLGVNA